jgi:hypothetical protein
MGAKIGRIGFIHIYLFWVLTNYCKGDGKTQFMKNVVCHTRLLSPLFLNKADILILKSECFEMFSYTAYKASVLVKNFKSKLSLGWARQQYFFIKISDKLYKITWWVDIII